MRRLAGAAGKAADERLPAALGEIVDVALRRGRWWTGRCPVPTVVPGASSSAVQRCRQPPGNVVHEDPVPLLSAGGHREIAALQGRGAGGRNQGMRRLSGPKVWKIIAPMIGQSRVWTYIRQKSQAAALLAAYVFIAVCSPGVRAEDQALNVALFKTGAQEIDRAIDIVAQRDLDVEKGLGRAGCRQVDHALRGRASRMARRVNA